MWMPPATEHWSSDKGFVLRVDWVKKKTLTLVNEKSPGRAAVWQRGFVDDDWPPAWAFVTNDGSHVVLVNRWGNAGYGKVIIILGPEGSVVKDYELQDILPKDEIRLCDHSVSSIYWFTNGWFSLVSNEAEFAFITQRGTVRCFDLDTGEMLELDEKKQTEISSLALNEMRLLATGADAVDRVTAITLFGTLGAKDTVGVVRKALTDRTRTSSVVVGSRPEQDVLGVQLAAAGALIKLTGADAIPLIEGQLEAANPHMKEELLRTISQLDSDERGTPIDSPHSKEAIEAWRRLCSSRDDAIRSFAASELANRGDMTYVRGNAALVNSADDMARLYIILALFDHGAAEDIPLLRKALNDPVSLNRSWAFNGLIRLSPADVDALLEWGAKSEDERIRNKAQRELKRREGK